MFCTTSEAGEIWRLSGCRVSQCMCVCVCVCVCVCCCNGVRGQGVLAANGSSCECQDLKLPRTGLTLVECSVRGNHPLQCS